LLTHTVDFLSAYNIMFNCSSSI